MRIYEGLGELISYSSHHSECQYALWGRWKAEVTLCLLGIEQNRQWPFRRDMFSRTKLSEVLSCIRRKINTITPSNRIRGYQNKLIQWLLISPTHSNAFPVYRYGMMKKCILSIPASTVSWEVPHAPWQSPQKNTDGLFLYVLNLVLSLKHIDLHTSLISLSNSSIGTTSFSRRQDPDDNIFSGSPCKSQEQLPTTRQIQNRQSEYPCAVYGRQQSVSSKFMTKR